MVSSWVSYISRDLTILNTSLSFWKVVPVTTAETVQLTNNKMLVSQNTRFVLSPFILLAMNCG
jgi:hypothetical protein